MAKWTTDFTVKFVPVPPEMEEAYWAAIHYFADVMFEDLKNGGDDLKQKHLLYRCHGVDAEDNARVSAEFIKGYFDLWNKRVKLFCEPYEYPGRADSDTPMPYDVFIETANDEVVNIAHAAGWSYLTGREVHEKELTRKGLAIPEVDE